MESGPPDRRNDRGSRSRHSQFHDRTEASRPRRAEVAATGTTDESDEDADDSPDGSEPESETVDDSEDEFWVQNMERIAMEDLEKQLQTLNLSPVEIKKQVARQARKLKEEFAEGHISNEAKSLMHRACIPMKKVKKKLAENRSLRAYNPRQTGHRGIISRIRDYNEDIPIIMMLGNMGGGKSSFGNMLARIENPGRSNVFPTGDSLAHVTLEPRMEHIHDFDGDRLLMIDTPGLGDKHFAENEIREAIVDFLLQHRRIHDTFGINSFVIVLNSLHARFTKLEEDLILYCMEAFGFDFLYNVRFVVRSWPWKDADIEARTTDEQLQQRCGEAGKASYTKELKEEIHKLLVAQNKDRSFTISNQGLNNLLDKDWTDCIYFVDSFYDLPSQKFTSAEQARVEKEVRKFLSDTKMAEKYPCKEEMMNAKVQDERSRYSEEVKVLKQLAEEQEKDIKLQKRDMKALEKKCDKQEKASRREVNQLRQELKKQTLTNEERAAKDLRIENLIRQQCELQRIKSEEAAALREAKTKKETDAAFLRQQKYHELRMEELRAERQRERESAGDDTCSVL